jgi:energy-coupling factor transport system ATP-binding protein
MMDEIIITHNLTHIYQTGPLAQLALADVSLAIARGSCVAIAGATGSGKSTLVQHFNGLLRPTSGSVIVEGVDVGAAATDLRALRQRVGMLFQSPDAQLFAPTVYADVAFGPQRIGLRPEQVRARVLAALDLVGLPPPEYGPRPPFELSGGQMRRVALASVLAIEPAVLVLDEPTVGLDADGRAQFYAYIRRAQGERGVTVVLVSHDMAEVAALADRLFVLHGGRLVAQGPPRRVFALGERLHRWGLLEPPLHELLALLRGHGVDVPAEVGTVEEAFELLMGRRTRKGGAAEGTEAS